MNCPKCTNRMRVNYTYRCEEYSTTNYLCQCGFRKSERTDAEEEAQITQCRISMPYDEFVRRINGLIPREQLPMRILLSRRAGADLYPPPSL